MSQSLYGWQTQTTPLTLFHAGGLGIVLSSFFFLGCSKLLMVISPNQSYLPNSEGNAALQNVKLGKIGLTRDGGEELSWVGHSELRNYGLVSQSIKVDGECFGGSLQSMAELLGRIHWALPVVYRSQTITAGAQNKSPLKRFHH